VRSTVTTADKANDSRDVETNIYTNFQLMDGVRTAMQIAQDRTGDVPARFSSTPASTIRISRPTSLAGPRSISASKKSAAASPKKRRRKKKKKTTEPLLPRLGAAASRSPARPALLLAQPVQVV
jgi:hypothetical protein